MSVARSLPCPTRWPFSGTAPGCGAAGRQGWELHLRIKAIVRSTGSLHANAQASPKRACVCNACHYPGGAFSQSRTVGTALTVASRRRAPAAKWAQKQLPAHRRGLRSGANSDGCHLPNFQVNNRPGQRDTLFWLLYLTAKVRHHSEDIIMQKRLSNISSFAVSSLPITQFTHTCNEQEHTDLPQLLQKSTGRQILAHTWYKRLQMALNIQVCTNSSIFIVFKTGSHNFASLRKHTPFFLNFPFRS